MYHFLFLVQIADLLNSCHIFRRRSDFCAWEKQKAIFFSLLFSCSLLFYLVGGQFVLSGRLGSSYSYFQLFQADSLFCLTSVLPIWFHFQSVHLFVHPFFSHHHMTLGLYVCLFLLVKVTSLWSLFSQLSAFTHCGHLVRLTDYVTFSLYKSSHTEWQRMIKDFIFDSLVSQFFQLFFLTFYFWSFFVQFCYSLFPSLVRLPMSHRAASTKPPTLLPLWCLNTLLITLDTFKFIPIETQERGDCQFTANPLPPNSKSQRPRHNSWQTVFFSFLHFFISGWPFEIFYRL